MFRSASPKSMSQKEQARYSQHNVLRQSLLWMLLVGSMLILVSCGSGPKPGLIGEQDTKVLDITSLFQTGQDRFKAELEADSALQRTWEGRREQVIMVLIDIEWDDGDREQAQQSGIILPGGERVLTAAHGFIMEEDARVTAIQARLVSGREITLKLNELSYIKDEIPPVDYALLTPHSPLIHQDFLPAQAEVDRHKLMILGYSASLGENSANTVVYVREHGNAPAYPLGIICQHHLLDQHTLIPRAGAIPLKGISGAPVFDSNGVLVGLFSSIGRRRTLDGWHYIFGIADIPHARIDSLQTN